MDKSDNNSINANESVKRVYCKVPVYKKLIGLGIIVTVTIYLIPEIKEKFNSVIILLREEWRKNK